MEALQRLHNRGSISTGYDIDNSVKLESDNTEFFSRSYSSASNRKTWTYSTWLKMTEIGINNYFFDAYNNSNTWFILGIASTGRIVFYDIVAGTDYGKQTDRLLRDTAAWYHIVFVSDTTNSTAGDRYRVYVNGVRETNFNTDYGDVPQNYDGNVNNALVHSVGKRTDGPSYFNGYLAETCLVDGTALDPTSFGEFDSDSGIWKPIDVSGLTFGTNGFYLDYEDASDLGDDESGNGNDFTENNIAAADQATDTPTNNFCTMNMLNRTDGNSKTQEGGTKLTTDGGSDWCSMVATMGVTKGKWYWETERGTNDVVQGIVGSEDDFIPYSSAAKYYVGNVAERSSMGFYSNANPNMRNGNGMSFDFDAGDILMIGLDMDNSKLYFGVNGTWQGSGDSIGGNTAGASTLWDDFDNEFVLPAVSVYQGGNMKINFGGYTCISISSGASDANGYGTFEHAPPSGYYALCTKNLEEFG